MPVFGDEIADEDIEASFEFIRASWRPQERAYQNQITQQNQAGHETAKALNLRTKDSGVMVVTSHSVRER